LNTEGSDMITFDRYTVLMIEVWSQIA